MKIWKRITASREGSMDKGLKARIVASSGIWKEVEKSG